MKPWPNPNSLIYIPYPRANLLKPLTAAQTYIAHIWQYRPYGSTGGGRLNAGSGTLLKECCFRVRVMGDVQMSNRLKLKIARCGIQNPGRFCLWNRKSWTLELLFRFFIYLFIFLDFWDQEKHFILTSRFDNAFQVFRLQPTRTCSGLPNKRSEHGGLPWFLTSSRKVREIFVFWVLYAFSTLGDHRQLVEWPAHFYFIKLTCKFFMFQASIYHTLPKTSDHFFSSLYFVGFDPCFHSRVLGWV